MNLLDNDDQAIPSSRTNVSGLKDVHVTLDYTQSDLRH